jgi:hypothetical protein
MLASHDQHDQFAHRILLKTTGMGLGLVRLLLDAGRIEEARGTLSSLENRLQGIATASDMPSQKPCQANRLPEFRWSGDPPANQSRRSLHACLRSLLE